MTHFRHSVQKGPLPIVFGTDGWRAIMAEEFTFENVRLCAQGTATFMKQEGLDTKGLVVGYDTRFASEQFAAAVAEVTAANGIYTLLSKRAEPTPVISSEVVSRGAGAGVIITASHNPAEWNGFKFKQRNGGSASPKVVGELERHIARAASNTIPRMTVLEALEKQLVEFFDPRPAYFDNIVRLVEVEGIRRSGLTVLVDSMFGSGSGFFLKLLGGGSTEVIELREERNPGFPGMLQPEPLAQNLEILSSKVVENGADIGLATDGDADRLGIVDENGKFVTTLQCFALLCLYHLEVLGKRGPLVRTITMTSMVDRLSEIYDVPVYDTRVGFQHLGPLMIEKDALIAGEESGGYAFRGNIPERDGILSGLMVLDMMVRTGKTLSQLLDLLYSKVGPHEYDRLDLRFDPSERQKIQQRMEKSHPSFLAGRRVESIDVRDGLRFVLEGGYWALLRFSGTEPLLRIYAEGASSKEVELLLEETRCIAGV